MPYYDTVGRVEIDPVGVNGGSVFATGINDASVIVGHYYRSADNRTHSFAYYYSADSYFPLDDPNAVSTFVTDINDGGEVTGWAQTATDSYAFSYAGGAFHPFAVPGATGASTQAMGLNDLGQIVGTYSDAAGTHGFLLSNGTYTTLDAPLGPGATYAMGINNAGQVVGWYSAGQALHGFLHSNGVWTTLDDPKAVGGNGYGTILQGIDDTGRIVGAYDDAIHHRNAFVYDGGDFSTLVVPDENMALGINNQGSVVGASRDVDRVGFWLTLAPPIQIVATDIATSVSDGYLVSSRNNVVLIVPAEVSVVATGAGFSGALFSNVDGSVEVHGTVQGNLYGIAIGGSRLPTTVAVGADGTVSGASEAAISIAALGDDPFSLENGGHITGLGAARGVVANGSGVVVNSGTIAGAVGVVQVEGHAGDVFRVYNLAGGRIEGAVQGLGFFAETIVVNRGVIAGEVRLGTGGGHVENYGVIEGDVVINSSAAYVGNAGHIGGRVVLGFDPDQVFNSTLGTVAGPIVLGDLAGGTAVGGQTGALLQGGRTNDVLIANQTQAAADSDARTTLAGGGGSNALYGGGGWNIFTGGDSAGGTNQVWGSASKMAGVQGFANNTLTFAGAGAGVYVDLLAGHEAWIGDTAGGAWTGTGLFEDWIANVPDIVGSAYRDVIRADNDIDRLQGGGGADSLYAGGGAAIFEITAWGDSNLVTGYDTIVGFKLGGQDKIDLSALHTDGTHVAISTSGTSNSVYLEQTPGTLNPATDLALVINTSAGGGVHNSDFIF